jgi:type IV secretory pathway protease TraF
VAAGPAGPPRRVTVALGERVVTWRLERADAALLVAGRLDGRFVAVAWPTTTVPTAADGSRVPWPPGIPAQWQVELPWSAAAAPFAAEVRCPEATVVAGGLWRDVVHRPAADGRSEWVLGPREVFLLGDAPAVSHDCRHYGAIDRGRLLAPLAID